jgi:nickel-dependent lactate racemase
MHKDIAIEYGDTWIEVSLPESATVSQYNTPMFPKIPVHSNPEQAVVESLKNPVGIERLEDLVKKGSKVTIAFDDPIKRPERVHRLTLPVVIDTLGKAGVREEDITLISANGVHCKWRPNELKSLVGPEIYNRFRPFDWRECRLLNHDCVHGNEFLGETDLGDEVEYDRALIESDQLIYVGTISPVPFGGYSGQGVTIGLGSLKALNSLHSYDVYKTANSLHGDYHPDKNLYRKHKLAVHQKIEELTGKKIFYIDAITGPEQRIVDVFAGHVPDLEKIEYPEADKYFLVKIPQFDIIVIGLPHILDYDTSNNPACACNFASRPARGWRNKPILREKGVIIALGECKGTISPRRPADAEALKLYRSCFGAKELYEYAAAFSNEAEYIRKYRYQYAYSPLHSIFLVANIDTLEKVASRAIFTGDINPGIIREVGAVPAKNFDEALARAKEIVGSNPDILVLPRYFHDPKPIFEVI